VRVTPVRLLAETASGSEVTLVRGDDGVPYARKAVRADLAGREDLERRIAWEGEVLARVGGAHHVVGLAGRAGAPPSLLLEYAPGGSLADRLAGERPLPAGEMRTVVPQLLEAVAHVHAAGLVHRDLKPSNVLFAADGGVRLIDFGVSARIGSRGTLGAEWEEEQVGTLAYAAPEQLLHPPSGTSPAADVYSLGVLLYEMASGRLPFELEPGEDEARLRERIIAGGAVPLRQRAVDVDPALDGIVSRALQRDPTARFRSVEALAGSLQALAHW
jgi:eukaryotic-like serine/threonine-protein kinase